MPDEVLEKLRDDLDRYLRRWIDPVQEREDLVQDVLLKLHLHGPQEEAVPAWVRRVARNAAIDQLRRRRPGAPLPPDLASHPEEPDATAEVAAWLPWLLLSVDEPYRTAVRRVDLDGEAQAALAAELGISPSGLRSRVQRGRRQLRDTLLACCAVRFDEGEVIDTGCPCPQDASADRQAPGG